MKNKIISAILVAGFLGLQMISMVSAIVEDDVPIPTRLASKAADNDKAAYKNIIGLLKYLDIVDESVEALNMEKEVKRDFALASVARMVGSAGNITQKPYPDVPLKNENAAGIALAKSLGIAEDMQSFKPDANVTGEELSVWILKALGYSDLVPKAEAFRYALNLGIFNGVPSTDTLSYEEFFLVLENAMNVSPLKQSYNGGDISISEDSDETFLSKRKGIVMKKGVVTGVGTASYDDYRMLDDNHIEIDKEMLKLLCESNMEYLGKKVCAYVDISDDKNDVICIWENGNSEWKINHSDIEAAQADKLSFYNEDGKLKSLKVSPGTKVFYNDCWYSNYADALEITENADNIVAVDNNNDSVADLIRVYYYEDYMVNSVSVVGNKISFKNGFGVLKFENDDVLKINLDGKSIELSELKENDVVTVMKNKRSDNTNVIILNVSRKNISGVIKGMDSDDNGKYFIVDSGKYYLSDEYQKYLTDNKSDEKPSLNRECVFYLSVNNQIVFSRLSGEYEYAYLQSSYYDDESEEYFIKTYTISGDFEKLKLKKKLKYYNSLHLDGITVKDIELYNDITNEGRESVKPSLIAYKRDNEGSVSEFALPIDKVGQIPGTVNYPLVKNYSCGMQGTVGTSRLYTGYINCTYDVNGTKAFVVPNKPEDLSNEKKYKIMPSLSSYGNDYYFSKEYVDLYNVDKFYHTAVATVRTGDAISSSIDMFFIPVMISKVKTVLNDDNMPVKEISFYANGALTTKRISDRVEVVGEEDGLGWLGTAGDIEDFGVGDIIQYDLDTAGDISLIRRLFKFKNPGTYRIQGGDNREAEAPVKVNKLYGISLCYGIVTDKSSDVILVDVSDSGKDGNIVNNYVTSLYNPTTYLILDTKSMTVSPASYSEIMQGDKIIIRKRYNAATDMFIIR